jgi:hypothetical protein
MNIDECVDELKSNRAQRAELPGNEWGPAIVHASSLADIKATSTESDTVAFGLCPADLKRFWQLARSARLFEDVTTGQWGLEILSPDEAARETKGYYRDRERDSLKGDLIIGRFIGDSELLLVRCDPDVADFGSIVIVGPIDPRSYWRLVSRSFGEFLSRYVETRGEMFWEHGSGEN